jgi:hypothetical protein
VVVNAFLSVAEEEWSEIRGTAESEDYIEQLVDKKQVRSFIVSLKRNTAPTGPLVLPASVS